MKKSKSLITKLDENGLIPNCLIRVYDWKVIQRTENKNFTYLFWKLWEK